jgi:hypothetical protein
MSGRSKLYLSTRQVFEELEKNQLLVHANGPGIPGVKHFWGKPDKQGAGVGLRAYWMPRRIEKLLPPRMTAYQVVLPGPNGANRTVHLYPKYDKPILVEIWLYAEQGQPKIDIERLFELYALALAQVLLVESDYGFSGDWIEQDALSVATDCMRCQLQMRIPLIEQHPVALCTDDSVSLITPSP